MEWITLAVSVATGGGLALVIRQIINFRRESLIQRVSRDAIHGKTKAERDAALRVLRQLLKQPPDPPNPPGDQAPPEVTEKPAPSG